MNFAQRLYCHCEYIKVYENNGWKSRNPTIKEAKMNSSIDNKESVLFEILDNDSDKEKSYIQKHKENVLMLNVKLRK